jgi:hypothetical protein
MVITTDAIIQKRLEEENLTSQVSQYLIGVSNPHRMNRGSFVPIVAVQMDEGDPNMVTISATKEGETESVHLSQ